jgi:hypothetical protein
VRNKTATHGPRREQWKGAQTVSKHDPTRDGDVHPHTAEQLDSKDFEKSSQTPTGDGDNNDDDD